MTRPEVSVCLPAYRAERYLAAAIDSVVSQTHSDWELVIVDNASPDRTGEIARSYDDPRIRVETNDETLDLADNWNLAVRYASGRYIKVLPADDLLRPDCLAQQAKLLDAHPELSLVSCRRDFIDDAGEVVLRGRGLEGLLGMTTAQGVIDRVMATGINPIGEPAAMMFRRNDFMQVGDFDATLPFPMDLELAVRLLRNGTFHGTDAPLAAFRVRADSFTGRGLSTQGAEHRELLRRIARDRHWSVTGASLLRGLTLTRVASLKRRLLFMAVTQPWRPMRRLPALVLEDAILAEVAATESARDLV